MTARAAVAGAAALLGVALAPARADAFCGFFVAGSNARLTNNASQVVLMRKGNRTVMTMSNTYQGPPQDFAMVVPVPVVLQKENVRTLPADVFDKVDSLSAPRLVEYWEADPCGPDVGLERQLMFGARQMSDVSLRKGKKSARDLGVTVEARFVVGEYEVVILSAKESQGLDTWLRQSGYHIPAGAAAALAPYVRDRSKFFVARVDITKVRRDAAGVVQLSPLRFSFDTNELRLPVRLGLLNATGKQDLIVYVINPDSRFEVANYRNAFIPTNLEVGDGVRDNFSAFYAELFDATVERMGRRVVVTEYAWQTTKCDPCPGPVLTLDDLSTLGLDVLEGIGAASPTAVPPPGTTKPSVIARYEAKVAATRARPSRFVGRQPSWVLTRLHARYDKESLAEDLVFREAPPVVGGRGGGQLNEQDAGAQLVSDGTPSTFQGRYIIRHYWTGPVTCETPQFERWGGAARRSLRQEPGDTRKRSGHRAARQGRAAQRGPLAGAIARHRWYAAAGAQKTCALTTPVAPRARHSVHWSTGRTPATTLHPKKASLCLCRFEVTETWGP